MTTSDGSSYAGAYGAMVFKWSDRYEVGIPEIDAQHRRFLDITNKLFHALNNGSGASVIGDTLTELVAHAEDHFATEMRYMVSHQTPGREVHDAAHVRLLAGLAAIRKFAGEGDPKVCAVKLGAYLKDWLLDHILRDDKEALAPLRGSSAPPKSQ